MKVNAPVKISQTLGIDNSEATLKLLTQAVRLWGKRECIDITPLRTYRQKLIKWELLVKALRQAGYVVSPLLEEENLKQQVLTRRPTGFLAEKLSVPYRSLVRLITALQADDSKHLSLGYGLKLIEIYPEEAMKFLEDCEKFFEADYFSIFYGMNYNV